MTSHDNPAPRVTIIAEQRPHEPGQRGACVVELDDFMREVAPGRTVTHRGRTYGPGDMVRVSGAEAMALVASGHLVPHDRRRQQDLRSVRQELQVGRVTVREDGA